jgi:hypothetical protein
VNNPDNYILSIISEYDILLQAQRSQGGKDTWQQAPFAKIQVQDVPHAGKNVRSQSEEQ